MKDKIFTIKFSEKTQKMLEELLEWTGTINKSDIIRQAIQQLWQTKKDQN
jgi:metal-responsive CopG/Arc/MetJ family transcriptional regulator